MTKIEYAEGFKGDSRLLSKRILLAYISDVVHALRKPVDIRDEDIPF